MKVLIIVGKNRSGKSTIAKFLIKKTSWPIIEISDIVKRVSGQKAREALQMEKQKHINDPDWLYREVSGEIRKNIGNVIIAGVREQYLIKRMKEDLFDVKVVGAVVSDQERRRRTVELDKKSEEEFYKEEMRDKTLFDLDSLISSADFQISTEKSLEEVEVEVEQVLKCLNKEYQSLGGSIESYV